ncbi:MAG: hypothetical protein ABIH46_13745, partial [Chloroflexota bacterium]
RTVRSHRVKVVEKWESKTEGIMIPAFTLAVDGKKGQLARQCTRTWKIDAIRRFLSGLLKERGLRKTPEVAVSIQGISWDEATRMRDSDVKYVVNEYPLVDLRMTRQDCIAWLESHGLPVPAKSSCVFCPYQNKESWRQLVHNGGPDLEVAIHIDEAIRNKRDLFPVFIHPLRVPLLEAVKDDGQLEFWPEATCDGGYCFV